MELIRTKMRNVLFFSFAFVLFPISLIVVFNFVLFVSSQSIKGHVVEGIDQYFYFFVRTSADFISTLLVIISCLVLILQMKIC